LTAANVNSREAVDIRAEGRENLNNKIILLFEINEPFMK
jgi:hypothetical protein